MSVGQILMICAVAGGLLVGMGAVIEDEVEQTGKKFGRIFLACIAISIASGFVLSAYSDCTFKEALLLEQYCGSNMASRFHYAFLVALAFSFSAFLISLIRKAMRHGKSAH